ncbi:hypothetical protein F4780DRAFT_781384 [Xylariomycetidae sp. FL0641]|nr:hypothetical protein F4780DRAFT_781384 [Xylariomycetidae sp. FL0641]
MAIRYTAEALIQLRESPLCVKPAALPPAEEWMGTPPDTFRNNQGKQATHDRNRNNDNSLLEQTNRRPGVDRHVPRNSANPDEIILGPPRMTFNSATLRSNKSLETDKYPKDAEPRDRFAFRSRNGDGENADRTRDREREGGRTNFRRRGEGDESDGWSTVKPRKSFGHEGAERFHGRMGERPERFGGERRPRDQDDRENTTDRPRRNFGEFAREKEGEDGERPRRNGLNRNRADQPWTSRDGNETAPAPRERFDRTKSWRERAVDDHNEMQQDKPRERTYERRWDRDRDHRQERDPEWLDEPFEDQSQGHTQEDFRKFMDAMKGKTTSKPEPTPAPGFDMPTTPLPKTESEKAPTKSLKSTPAIELGQDKFFAAFTGVDPGSSAAEAGKESTPIVPPKPKSGSRFQNFFSSQEEARRQTAEPAQPAVAAPPPPREVNPLLAALASPAGPAASQDDAAEKVAFQALLQKLQKQTLQASTPPNGGFAEPPPSQEFGSKGSVVSPGSFSPYAHERRDDAILRGPPQNPEVHEPRMQPGVPFTGMRPEQQMLHDLVGQRHPSQNSGRADQPPSRNSNSNKEFLMTLMQSSRAAPEPIMRMPQPSRPAQIPPTPDREPDYQRERQASQPQLSRPLGLPSFFDDMPMHSREQEPRPQHPTQILQRQAPPGLDQIHPPAWMQTGGQQMPPHARPMIPPPGLAGNQRTGPMPGGFHPNFPMGGFPPPDGMSGPPRNMAPPPGFFGGPPPPGFLPPPVAGFQGPDALAFGFDGRGMPPPGAGGPFRR